MKFQTSKTVVLLNGGYLSDKETKLPIFNQQFIDAQKRAEFICLFAEEAKDKDFTGKKADSLAEVEKKTLERIAGATPKFFDVPKEPTKSLTSKLAAESLEFINYHKNLKDVDKLNAFMLEFTVLKDFEDFGLFFDEGIVKLNKIYTLEEIKAALKETINYL